MTDDRRDHDIALALAEIRERRTRGETPDVLELRDRLGESHAEFVDLLQVDAMIDDVIEPPAPERLPREFGAYTLLRQLGRGAIGVVYEARHTKLGRKVAIKVLLSKFDRDTELRERFRREAIATARVRHDHIVEMLEAGEVAGSPFYAMSLVEGRSLSALIKARELPPIRDLCRELAGIADALDALHRSRPAIIHRDVKPSNIMVRPDGRMILADFGLARASDSLDLTRTGVAVGTPLYMSPEQMLGNRDEVDARADVYSLGATLYEAVAGKPVFEASTIASLAALVASERRPVGLRTLASACPASLEGIVMKALEKHRDDRFKSAAQLRDSLLAVAEGRENDVHDRPVSSIRRTMRWGRSPVGIAMAAGVLAAVGAAFWWTSRSAMLDLSSLPEGVDVLVGGTQFGRTPLSRPLKPGSYDFVLRADGFVDKSKHVDLSPGGKGDFEVLMEPKDKNDPAARMRMFRSLNLGAVGYGFGRDRSSGTPLVFVHPRGDVRREDLDKYGYEVDLGAGLPDEGGMLEFRRGEEVLSTEPFALADGRTIAKFPDKVRSALKIGDVVTWGLRFKGRAEVTKRKDVIATFTLVNRDPTADLAKLHKRLEGLPDDLLGDFEVRTLWAMGLNSAALARANDLADKWTTSLPLQALARQAYGVLKINQSSRIDELVRRVDAFPAADVLRLKNDVPVPTDAHPNMTGGAPGAGR